MRKTKLLTCLKAMGVQERTQVAHDVGTTPEHLLHVAHGHRNFSIARSLALAYRLDLTFADVRPDIGSDTPIVAVPQDEYRGLKALARRALDESTET